MEGYRVYRNRHYENCVRLKKRLAARVKSSLKQTSEPNTIWSLDFASDVMECGMMLRVLNMMDDSDKVVMFQ